MSNKNKNILIRVAHVDCTLALYRKDKTEIKEKCALEISSPQEVIIQLKSTSFYKIKPQPLNKIFDRDSISNFKFLQLFCLHIVCRQ